MSDRAKLLDWLRSDILGPHTPPTNPCDPNILFNGNILDQNIVLADSIGFHKAGQDIEEILQFGRETPKTRYGVGVLYPPSENENKELETKKEQSLEEEDETEGEDENAEGDGGAEDEINGASDVEPDDYSITSENPFRPNQLGISFYVKPGNSTSLRIQFPKTRKVSWKSDCEKVNGRYFGNKNVTNTLGREIHIYARFPIGNNDASYKYEFEVDQKEIHIQIGSEPAWLKFKVYCRKFDANFLVTVILANDATDREMKYHLFQSFFSVKAVDADGNNMFLPYPGLERISVRNDCEEDQLRLLYRNFENWGIGHGCSCGWDAQPGTTPDEIYADVMPAVETPSMDTNVEVDGVPILVSMKNLAGIDENDGNLEELLNAYGNWIANKNCNGLNGPLKAAAEKHLEDCRSVLQRMRNGLEILRDNPNARLAFRLANQAICLQQIATKKIKSRKLVYNQQSQKVEVEPVDNFSYAHEIYKSEAFDNQTNIGYWRPFQIAFFLMSIKGITDPDSSDRKVVDLIWFPTGGGKTEAYLGVAAFTMFFERLIGQNPGDFGENSKFGTNVFMRYTLRLLTTQQVQRAASLFCAMEQIRRNDIHYRVGKFDKRNPGVNLLGNKEFVLGLWAGEGVSPNTKADATEKIGKYRKRNYQKNNPLLLYRCPYCCSQIGVYNHASGNSNPPDNYKPNWGIRQDDWNKESAKGPLEYKNGWWNRCPDAKCLFGDNNSAIPLQVVDESLYKDPPSMFIATVDKFAMLAVKKEANSLFKNPPTLIIQDELHLISGPLGSLYGLYETLVEKLCSRGNVVPKIICSTATIKGAHRQVKNLYGRDNLQLFPPPALAIEDSFFGRYAIRLNGDLHQGRLYVGINAHYSSALTTQVRVFSRIHQGSRHLFNGPNNPDLMDHYYTLICFYNSIRELSGGKTLFDSDILSRISSHLNVRDKTTWKPPYKCPELTGRLSQNKLLQALENLEKKYNPINNEALDACLASSVIEVGVDIDRLALMAVVGQPKTTAQYIQVTGRVGRNWKNVPGLVLTLFSPSKPRDISHYEQFHSYHRRLYEYVEPTSVTPFSEATLERALAAILFGWLVQNSKWNPNPDDEACEESWNEAKQFVNDKGIILGIQNTADIVGKLEAIFKKTWSFKYENRDSLKLHSWNWSAEDDFILFPYAEHAQCSEQNLIRFMNSLRSVDMSTMAKIQIFDHVGGKLNPPLSLPETPN